MSVPRTARRRLPVLPWATLLAIAVLAPGCSPSRTVEAIQVLGDIEAGDGPSALKESTPAPTRQAIRYTIQDRIRDADLYLPGEMARAGIVLVPGLTPRGRDDPRLVDFALTLARARFEVVVPDLPGMRALQVSAAEAAPIADAAAYVEERMPARPLGIAAVSFAVGPAVLAMATASQPTPVDFFLGIGGYYDLPALLTYVTTGFYRDASADWQYRPPKQYGKWVFVLSNAHRIADLQDRGALLEMADRKLDDADAGIDDLASGLGDEGASVLALITNTDPEKVPELLAGLPPAIRSDVEALDLRAQPLDHLQATFILIHDRNDRIIPAEQTRQLAAALPADRAQVHIVSGLDHAQVESLGIGDALSLVDAITTVLRFRDGSPPD